MSIFRQYFAEHLRNGVTLLILVYVPTMMQ